VDNTHSHTLTHTYTHMHAIFAVKISSDATNHSPSGIVKMMDRTVITRKETQQSTVMYFDQFYTTHW
jgi:hypothetical protein